MSEHVIFTPAGSDRDELQEEVWLSAVSNQSGEERCFSVRLAVGLSTSVAGTQPDMVRR